MDKPQASAPEFTIPPPVEPMLARIAKTLPAGGSFLYEPKWDGFRAIVFRGSGGDVFIQSRDLKPLDRYFPELHDVFATALPDGCVVDGEIVIATPHGLDFDALQLRLQVLDFAVPKELLAIIPYVLAIAAMALFVKRIRLPAALGRPYGRE